MPSGAPSSYEANVRIATLQGLSIMRAQVWESERVTTLGKLALPDAVLPAEVGGVLAGRAWKSLCVGPGDWLLSSTALSNKSLYEQCAGTLSRPEFVLVDISESLKVVEIQGQAVRDVLAKGCGLDFHSTMFGTYHCARTRFAGMQVVIECMDSLMHFHLYVARSYECYLTDWLCDAALEFGHKRTAGKVS